MAEEIQESKTAPEVAEENNTKQQTSNPAAQPNEAAGGGLAALLSGAGAEKWVTLELKLVNWTFSNFKLRVRTSTKFSTIQYRLREKHGDMQKLILYRDQVAEENVIEDFTRTLMDTGITGAPKGAPEVHQVFYYDFTPISNHNPLLLVTPRQFDIKVYDATTKK